MRAGALLMAVTTSLGGLAAQSYSDFTMVRNRPWRWPSFFQAKAGVTAGFAKDPVPSIGLEDEVGVDGSLYYHTEDFTERQAILDLYAGRDGAFLGIREQKPGQATSRLDLTARYFPFYREGFYRDGDYIPTGRYAGSDFGAYLGVGTMAAEGLLLETGPFYRRNTFERNSETDPFYTIPDDYNAYGIRFYAEHNTLVLDREYNVPHDGFIVTLLLEREQNDQDGTFGTPLWTSDLPSGMWRLLGHLEWYVPTSIGGWEIHADGSWSDTKDRIYNYDAQKQIGELWIEGSLGYRFQFGGLGVTPRAIGQWVQAVQENGITREKDLFYGGGLRVRYELSDAFSFYADYSYVTNQSRLPVSAKMDTLGEQQLFAGVELRFGTSQ